MESYDPEELTSKVKQEQEETSNLAVEAVQWFLDEDHIEQLYPRGDVVQEIAEYLEVPQQKAADAITSIVGDIVDPVQQVVTREGRFVGAIDYKVFNDEGAYGYIHFDDRLGERKRVVCARCVEKETLDENIIHATQGEGTSNVDATWQQLLNKVTSHYANAHTQAPEDIEPGASLLDGTTISGNTSFHAGNESAITIENAGTSGSDGTVPKSQGDGTLTMESISGGTTVTSINPTEAVSGEEPSGSGLVFASEGSVASANGEVLLGNGINANVGGGFAMGDNIDIKSILCVAIGDGVYVDAGDAFTTPSSIAIGTDAKVDAGSGSIALGPNAEVSGTSVDYSIALGEGTTVNTSNTMRVNLGPNNRVMKVDEDGNVEIAGTLSENETI